jgi:arylsulfatase A-like enzyme/uncharacterized membrane protein YbhN (UPF0104 family)
MTNEPNASGLSAEELQALMAKGEELEGDQTLSEANPPSVMMAEGERAERAPAKPSGPNRRQWILFAVKAVLSALLVYGIARSILSQQGVTSFGDTIAALQWQWIAVGLAVHLVGVAANVTRWRTLLRGQGIHAPVRFALGSLLIARFIGALSPGGFTGFGGWRIYDIGTHTGKWARATATIGVETIVGWLAFGSVVMLGSIFGASIIGTSGVLLVNAAFGTLIAFGLTLIVKPVVFSRVAALLPAKVRLRVQTLIDALQSYRGNARALVIATLCAVVVHTTHFLIYVCTARALGVTEIGIGTVFFGSALQILATMVPASINGIGLREMTAVALYTSLGVPLTSAVLIASLGFALEMSVSLMGAPIFLARRSGYKPNIQVDDADRENAALAAIPEVEASLWPSVRRGLELGLGGGALAGLVLGLAEGALVISGGRTDMWVLAYGAIAYTLFFAIVGACGGAALAYSGRMMKREAFTASSAYAYWTSGLIAVAALGIGAFRIRRDVFHEELAWTSVRGLGVLLACMATAAVLFLALNFTLRALANAKAGQWLTRAWGTPALVGAIIAVLVPTTLALGAPERPALPDVTAHAPQGAGNVLVIVVDTMRADHLPPYGYTTGSTPNLDAFARDAIRFDQAFANASWTRPSFASILTGRYPSSHNVMAKTDALPSSLTTLAEAYREQGYFTSGVVTNYNVGPYFNFDQGFDEYNYLAPSFVLGADDSAAKLLLVQFLRQRIEGIRDRTFGVQPGTTYQPAPAVNAEILAALERAPQGQPWMMFAGYMDPHDPYYAHPYNGEAYSRAAHPSPSPDEAEHLTELYDGEITYWDEHFGALVAELRRRGLYDDLTIVITADHGEEFCEHGGFFHGTTLYDEQVHVPLFVKLPRGQRGGEVVNHWVQSIDIMPTLLRESGLTVPEGIQGGRLFEGSSRLFAEESHEGNILQAVRERQGTEEIKLITANAGNPRRLPTTELFRVDVDPGELDNLANNAPLLERATQSLQSAATAATQDAVQGESIQLDDESTCQLCALGYMTGEACERCGH